MTIHEECGVFQMDPKQACFQKYILAGVAVGKERPLCKQI